MPTHFSLRGLLRVKHEDALVPILTSCWFFFPITFLEDWALVTFARCVLFGTISTQSEVRRLRATE